ncbi:AMP-binding protein [Bacillus mangrovi]|uniref:AMP-binding protein n=1 Tax=Metabacillus mangrovi TaxID=1491830 RepID=A0A7X2S465_9BACI|nr:AMP-binding protein [Metabacillus mangrovi]MTH52913.1 AMP-binding protein [Metabacillus mangrovi]
MDLNRPWLDHYPDEIPPALAFEPKTLPAYLEETAAEFPQNTAITFFGKKLAYAALFDEARKLAAYLQGLGMKKGDRAAIMLPNCPQGVISYYGVLMAGGIVVSTNPLYTEREIEYQMNDSEAEYMITLDLLFPRVSKVKALTKLKHVIVAKVQDYLPFPKNILYPFVQRKQTKLKVQIEPSETTHLFSEIMKKPAGTMEKTEINPVEDVALLQYTGGTTGFPKGVMLTHKNIAANTIMCSAWMYNCRRGQEKVLGLLPFFHVYGMTTVMHLSVTEGYNMVLLPKFDATDTLKAIHKEKPTLFPGAPTIYIALLNHPELKKYDLSSVHSCISGSAPLPVEIQERFEKETGGKLVEGYGLSEASPVTHSNFLWGRRVKGSIGVPWPNTDAMILSVETGNQAEPGEKGELLVRGPQVMKGYWGKPEETEAVLKDGWLFTGDIGYMDEEGYFYIVDRKKDMIIAGGYNIYPREVEEILYEYDKIQEVVVAGVPDPYRGETVKAYVVPKEGVVITEEELNLFARKHLAAYKVPRIYEFRSELPKTAVGKILRRTLIEEEKEKLKNAN